MQVGSLDTKAAPPTLPVTPPPPQKKKELVKPEAISGAIVPQPTEAAAEEAEAFDSFGDLVPYADPSWYQTCMWAGGRSSREACKLINDEQTTRHITTRHT